MTNTLDAIVADALAATARRLEHEIDAYGLAKMREVKHLQPAFLASLTATGVPEVHPSGKRFALRTWEPHGVKGRLGAFDVVVGPAPKYSALFELKWARIEDELGWTLWDIYKLAAARIEYNVETYAIVGASTEFWADEAVGCSSLYCDGVWSSADLFQRYERDWRNLLAGGTARPIRVPATIETRLIRAEPLDTSPTWELRALSVGIPGFEWLEFEGDWPTGMEHVAADA
jgi:hypothetical protein